MVKTKRSFVNSLEMKFLRILFLTVLKQSIQIATSPGCVFMCLSGKGF